MARAVECPVCHGKGKIIDEDSNSLNVKKQCHGCGGRGWVTVPEEKIAYRPEFQDKQKKG